MDKNVTVTTVFMVPTLEITKERLLENDFLNSYIRDLDNPLDYDEYTVFLLFKPQDMKKFLLFIEEEYERTEAILEDYDYEGGYVVVVYKLNEAFKKDFDLIFAGKYSKTSKKFQKIFTDTVKVKGKNEDSLQKMIFNRSEEMVSYWEENIGCRLDINEGLEVWPLFMLQKEILDIKEYKKQKND